ncbi:MAG: hypothetical protein MJ113_04720 [Lachnospiraceae bacterium]|nr:hypothetical protein [Lachnospiraceae bacterium]
MSKIVILLTKDSNYNKRFANWINLNRSIGYLCSSFDDAGKALDFIKDNKVTHILISEEFQDYFDDFCDNEALKFVLTEDDYTGDLADDKIIRMKSWPEVFELVFKYKRMQDLLRELEMISTKESEGKDKIITLFSPENAVSFEQAADYVEKLLTGHSLFISFESFPYFETDLKNFNQGEGEIKNEREEGLSELIYEIKQRKASLRKILRGKLCTIKNYSFDLVRGMNCFPDLYQLSSEDAKWFLEAISAEGDYETIFIFVKSLTEGTTEFLMKCDRIDLFSDNATESFFKQLKFAGLNDVIEKINVIKV